MGVFMQHRAIVNANITPLRDSDVIKSPLRRYALDPNGKMLDCFHVFNKHDNSYLRHLYSVYFCWPYSVNGYTCI